MAQTAELVGREELQRFVTTAVKNESTESITESCEAVKNAARKVVAHIQFNIKIKNESSTTVKNICTSNY